MMKIEYDKTVVDYWQKADYYYFAKLVRDEGIDGDGISEDKNPMPLQLEASILSNSKRRKNTFVLAIDGFKVGKVYYTNSDSLYTENQ